MAQSDHFIELGVTNFPDVIGMELDLDIGTNYIAAHGAMIAQDGEDTFKVPIDGSCLLEQTQTVAAENVLTCSLSFVGRSLLLSLNVDVGEGGITDWEHDDLAALVTLLRVE